MKPSMDVAYFEQETHLNDEIVFNQPLSPYAHQPRNIFVTGTTGLLGGFLLEELLQKTTANIYCLVRAENAEIGKQRLIKHLQSYGLWQERFDSRVIAVIGDLALPLFGLSETEFNTLATQIDVIYHSAGWINLLFPYPKLKPINVTGVEQALRLASLVHTKPFHFVSSIAVFYSDAHPGTQMLYEDDVPLFHSSIKADYGKSKWVADRLVANAQARGLPTTIYRPIRIMGSSVTGALNDNSELLPRLLKGCIRMGVYPNWDIDITLVPADYAAHAIAHISQQESCWNKAYHLFNPQPIAWHDLMEILKSLGYQMKEVTPEHWSQELRHYATWDNPDDADSKRFFAMLMVAFTGMHYLFHQRPVFDGRNIEAGLAGSGISCHPVDAELIGRYVAYWQKSGFLPSL
jgi:thioester reductase-like protein